MSRNMLGAPGRRDRIDPRRPRGVRTLAAVGAAVLVAGALGVVGSTASADPPEAGPNVDSVSSDRGLAVPGDTVNWTVSVSNTTGVDISSPVVVIEIPAGLDLDGPITAGEWGCVASAVVGPATVTCTGPPTWSTDNQIGISLPTVAASAVGFATVNATAQPGGSAASNAVEIVAAATAQIAAHVSPDVSPVSGAQVTITGAVTFAGATARWAYVNFNGPSDGLTIDSASADNGFVCNVWANGVNCSGDAVPAGTTVTLTVVATVTAPTDTSMWLNVNGGASNVVNNAGTNLTLTVGAVTLSGRVTVNDDPYSDTPIANVCVNANAYDGGPGSGSSSTDSFGNYQLAVPPNATYRIQYSDCSQPSTFAQTFYPSVTDYNAAAPVVVGTQAIAGLDARMTGGRHVSGLVQDHLGQPVSGVQVSILEPNTGSWISGATTAPDGTWATWSPVPPGSYLVNFQPPTTDLSGQWWDHQDSPTSATLLEVEPGNGAITDIDADLAAAVAISGTVGAQQTGVEGLCIEAYVGANPSGNGGAIAGTQSAADGSYTLAGLPATAAVKILVRDCRAEPTLGYGFYTPAGPTASFADATAVTGPATDVDLFLSAGASVSGRVTDAQTGAPLSEVCAAVINPATGVPIYVQPINADGTFTLSGLAPGTYYAASGDCEQGTRPLEWYDGADGIPFDVNTAVDPVGDGAVPIRVAAGAAVTGIDFRLGPAPDATIGFPASKVKSRGASTVTLVVTRTGGDLTNAATVAYATVDGASAFATLDAGEHPAHAGTDYKPASGVASFAPGSTQTSITIQLTAAGVANIGAQVSVVLSSPSTGAIGNGTATITVTSAPADGTPSVPDGDGGETGGAPDPERAVGPVAGTVATRDTPEPGSLAFTGADPAMVALIALVAVAAGGLLTLATRRASAGASSGRGSGWPPHPG